MLIAVTCILYNFLATSASEIEISEGLVSGVHLKTHDGREISAFLGVPYAEPPIGHLRFVFNEKKY